MSVGTPSRGVLVPMTFCNVNASRKQIVGDAITAAPFTNVPTIKAADSVTLLEEDRIVGYWIDSCIA